MPSSPHPAVASFRRRIGWSAFAAGAGQAVLVTGVTWAVTLLVVRLCGRHLEPSWGWLLLALPVIGWAIFRAHRESLSPSIAAAHLDRRLGLGGLLLCVDEHQQLDAAWQARVDRGLLDLPAALPRTRWGSILPLPLLAAGLAVLIAFLPPPPLPEDARHLPAFQAEVGRLGSELRDLFERGNVPEEVERELQQKHAELKKKVDAGEMPEWRDFDEIDQRISREQLMQLAAEGRGEPGSTDGSGSSSDSDSGRGESDGRSLESIQAAAQMLAKLGLLDNLPAQFQAALDAVKELDGSFSLDDLPFDAAQLQALAKAFEDTFGELGDLSSLGLGKAQLADLQRLVEGFGGGQGQGQGQGAGNGNGAGGVERGPGHAALSLTESVEGSADKAMPLPQGRGLPHEWVPVDSKKIQPVVNPVTNTAAGRAGASGTGGASWQLEYAPRHRAVLRKFFGSDSKNDSRGGSRSDSRRAGK